MTMLGFSAAYHVQRSSERRDLLRRLDHAAIFVMIAGTYTPLYRLHLGWRLRDLAHQVDVACSSAGVAVKLAYPRRSEWASTVAYVAMGWAVVIFMQPLLRLLDRSTVILLVSGGALYSIGACIHRWHRLPFQMPSGTVWYWSPLAFYCRSDPLPETRSVAPTVDFHVSEVSLADDHRVTAAERYLRPRKFELIGRLITLTPYSFWRWQHSMHRSSWNNSTGARPVAWISTHRARGSPPTLSRRRGKWVTP